MGEATIRKLVINIQVRIGRQSSALANHFCFSPVILCIRRRRGSRPQVQWYRLTLVTHTQLAGATCQRRRSGPEAIYFTPRRLLVSLAISRKNPLSSVSHTYSFADLPTRTRLDACGCTGSTIYREWRDLIYNFVILGYTQNSDRAGYMSSVLATNIQYSIPNPIL